MAVHIYQTRASTFYQLCNTREMSATTHIIYYFNIFNFLYTFFLFFFLIQTNSYKLMMLNKKIQFASNFRCAAFSNKINTAKFQKCRRMSPKLILLNIGRKLFDDKFNLFGAPALVSNSSALVPSHVAFHRLTTKIMGIGELYNE